MEVACDKCTETFDIEIKEKKMDRGIVETYFHCTECNEKYVAFYTDEIARQLQRKIRKLEDKVEQTKSENTKRKLKADMQMTMFKLNLKMDKLKVEIDADK